MKTIKTNKRMFFFLLLFFCFSIGLLKTEDFSSPVGYWEVIDENTQEIKSIAKIYIKNNRLFGKLVMLFPKPGEEANPKCEKCKGKLKDQPILGMEFMTDFQGGGTEWKNGKILDPEKGKVYHCQLELLENGKKLKVFGYIKIIVKIGRSQMWRRTQKDKYPEVII